jgi:hypothetical protein
LRNSSRDVGASETSEKLEKLTAAKETICSINFQVFCLFFSSSKADERREEKTSLTVVVVGLLLTKLFFFSFFLSSSLNLLLFVVDFVVKVSKLIYTKVMKRKPQLSCRDEVGIENAAL